MTRGWWSVGGLVAVAVVAGCSSPPPARPLRVVGHACTRTIAIERLADVRARVPKAELASQGDVTAVTCDDASCAFTVRRWEPHRVAEARGAQPCPAWPAVELLAKTGDQLGIEREGARTATYAILVGDGVGEATACEVPEATWLAWTDGVELAGGRGDGGLACATLRPAR
jgi:hypothetical protein